LVNLTDSDSYYFDTEDEEEDSPIYIDYIENFVVNVFLDSDLENFEFSDSDFDFFSLNDCNLSEYDDNEMQNCDPYDCCLDFDSDSESEDSEFLISQEIEDNIEDFEILISDLYNVALYLKDGDMQE
jgi:hypothetical protein